jgi:phosphoribosyl 1,2-cyclic phosphate phosphodiesterase
MPDLKLTILGSGTSHGVPMIGCDCATCRSDDPRDRRMRSSALFSYDANHLLIDTSPELRMQCLAHHVRRVDAVMYTHAHADHIVGLDDLRVFCERQGRAMDAYAAADTLARLRRMFAYAFRDEPDYPSAKPTLIPHEIDGPFELFGRTITPIPLMHGRLPILGFRVGSIAYCTDCSEIPAGSCALLEGLDVLILDGLRRRPHPTHFNIDQAVEAAARIGARRTYFTHIAHELKHQETNAALPRGMELSYDGLVVTGR